MKLKFSIKNSTHYLPFLRKLVSVFDRLATDLNLDHQAKASCSLALVEAVNNVVFHAHKRDSQKWIDIVIKCGGDRVEMQIYDQGPGFDMPEFSVPPVDHVHGRGLFIIKSLMNEVEYKIGNTNKNMLKMVYYL